MPKLLSCFVLLFGVTAGLQADDSYSSSNEPDFSTSNVKADVPSGSVHVEGVVGPNRPWPESDWLPNGFVANNASNSGYGQPGGYAGRVGSPYFYSPAAGQTGADIDAVGSWGHGAGVIAHHGAASAAGCCGHGGSAMASVGHGHHGHGHHHGVVSGYQTFDGGVVAAQSHNDNRYGYSANPKGVSGTDSNVYNRHFGPGFYRHSQTGHYRFPYYSYRRPWYFQGHAVWARDTNYAW